jgi:hypothetical protein
MNLMGQSQSAISFTGLAVVEKKGEDNGPRGCAGSRLGAGNRTRELNFLIKASMFVFIQPCEPKPFQPLIHNGTFNS